MTTSFASRYAQRSSEGLIGEIVGIVTRATTEAVRRG
jgi:hypothetical protein